MEMSNQGRCPIHGLPLMMELGELTIINEHFELLMAKCPKCKVIYTGQRVKRLDRFTYCGKQYQYLPKLASLQNELKDRKDKKKRAEEERNQAKEKAMNQEQERRMREITQQKENKIEKQKTQQKRLLEKEEKLKTSMPKTIYVLSSIETKMCPICNKKIALNPISLTLQSSQNTLKDSMIMGYSCTKCHSVFIPEKIAEKEFLEQYTEHLNLDYLGTKVQNNKKMEEEQYRKKYPFLENNEIKVHFGYYIQKRCPVHKSSIRGMGWILTQEKRKSECLLHGFYCKECNAIYMSESERKKIQDYIRQQGKTEKVFEILPAELRKQSTRAVKVSFDNIPNTILNAPKSVKKQELMSEMDFKLAAYQKFDKEIVEVIACVDDEEKYVRILTSVNENDKQKCVPEDMLVREAETLGRELLGRIAHDQLDTFYAKGHEITIHHYKIWPDQEHHLDGFTKFIDPEKMQDITIMSQKNLARDSEEYEMVTALVYCANWQGPVYIDVYYSKRQDRYFINDESYRQYSARYGLPYMRLVPGEYGGEMDYGNLRQYSELNLYGYTVAKTADMTSGERQRLLQQLMDNGLMSKHQIVNHLEWLIHRQSGRIRMEDACDCWREDLKFVNNYRINQQRKICGRFVYGKTTLR